MTNDIKKIENAFVSNMGSGKIAAARLLDLVTFAMNGDSRNIASALFRLRKNGDTQGSKTVQQIVAIIFPEAKTKIAKDKKSLVITLGDNVDNDALDRFKNAVKDGLSIRGNLLSAIKGETDKTDFDLAKFAEQIAKRIAKENVTEGALVAAINTQVKALMIEAASKKAA
tara:strand:- start:2 stop:511 length:510 start_codon:yes stop_codon:yes gene_type:complete